MWYLPIVGPSMSAKQTNTIIDLILRRFGPFFKTTAAVSFMCFRSKNDLRNPLSCNGYFLKSFLETNLFNLTYLEHTYIQTSVVFLSLVDLGSLIQYIP